MKDIFKCMGLIIVGLLTAVIIYPFLHEVGHLLTALLVGAKITDFNILPTPFVKCEVTRVSDFGKILIGLGGMSVPFSISILFKSKSFWLWYINLIVKGISVYAILLSAIAVFLYMNGVVWKGEDIVQVLQISSKENYWLLAFALMTVWGFFIMIKEKPILKCCEYLEVI